MKKDSILSINKMHCTGCGACAKKCPKKCISMKPDKEGFLVPSIDADQCINCGICMQTCPVALQEDKLFYFDKREYFCSIIGDKEILIKKCYKMKDN